MKSSNDYNRPLQSQARLEALPLPQRAAPRALLSAMLTALMLAALASQVVPGMLVA